jgi:hypothetical protein
MEDTKIGVVTETDVLLEYFGAAMCDAFSEVFSGHFNVNVASLEATDDGVLLCAIELSDEYYDYTIHCRFSPLVPYNSQKFSIMIYDLFRIYLQAETAYDSESAYNLLKGKVVNILNLNFKRILGSVK